MAKRRPRPRPKLKSSKRALPSVAPNISLIPFVLHAGETLSDPIDVSTGSMEYLIMPEDWTPSYLSFQLSFDGTTWHDLYHPNGDAKLLGKAAPGCAIDLFDAGTLKNALFRVRSGSYNTAVPQQADRTFIAVLVP